MFRGDAASAVEDRLDVFAGGKAPAGGRGGRDGDRACSRPRWTKPGGC